MAMAKRQQKHHVSSWDLASLQDVDTTKYEEACLLIDSTDDKPKRLAFHPGNKMVLHRLPMSHFWDGPSQNKKCQMGVERHALPGLETRRRRLA